MHWETDDGGGRWFDSATRWGVLKDGDDSKRLKWIDVCNAIA